MAWVKKDQNGGGQRNSRNNNGRKSSSSRPNQQDFPTLGNARNSKGNGSYSQNDFPSLGSAQDGQGRGNSRDANFHNCPQRGKPGGPPSTGASAEQPTAWNRNNNPQGDSLPNDSQKPPLNGSMANSSSRPSSGGEPITAWNRGSAKGRGMGTNQETTPRPMEATIPNRGISLGRGRGRSLEADQARKLGESTTPAALIQKRLPEAVVQGKLPFGKQVIPEIVAQNSKQDLEKGKDQLIQDLKSKLSVESHLPNVEFVRRPGKGVSGRKFPVYANHFPLTIPSGFVYHYDVEIEVVRKEALGDKIPDATKKLRPLGLKINRLVIETLRKTDKIFKSCYPAFDGNKNMITRSPLPIDGEVVKIVNYEEEELRKDGTKKISQFKVTIKPTHKKDTKGCAINLDPLHQVFEKKVGTVPMEAVMAIEIILRHCPSLSLVPVGRSLYLRPDQNNTKEISGGLNIWFGYHQSVHVGENHVFLNIDRATTAFYPAIPLIELVFKILSDLGNRNPAESHSLQPYEIAVLSKELKNLKVYVKHLSYQRKFSIFSLSRESARDIEFYHNDKKLTVAQYFLQTYKIRLRYPMFPCVNVGTSQKPTYQPIELCYVKDDQPYKRKLNPRQTSDIIRSTAIPPKQRFEEIYRKLRQMDQICDPVKKEFGISIEKKPVYFQARQLNAPFLVYFGSKKLKPNNGVWDLKSHGFFHPATIEKWALVSLAFPRFCGPPQLDNFAKKLQEESRNYGMKMGPPVETYVAPMGNRGNGERVEDILKRLCKTHGPALKLCVIVLKDDAQYSQIKKTGDTILGMATQCIKDCNVVKKCNPQLLCNLLQKINVKVGGMNVSLWPEDKPEVFKRPLIIIGADVTHPAPGDKIRPSIAAVVGSIDSNPSRYAVSVRVQAKCDKMQRRLEIIQDLKIMIKELLKSFYKSTHFKPESIVFFRDGVSEGQFEEVRDREIAMIKAACEEMSTHAPYNPSLTFVVIQKRHHTRFLPAQDCDGVGKCGNIPPGTTVDTTVTHPHIFDFFQCSHFGIQGTSRPTKYTILYDDAHFSADEMQRLTFYLCHTYVRCTRSISVPSPVQYAHLAAFRAKEHLAFTAAANGGSSSSGIWGDQGSEEDMEMGEVSPEILEAIRVPGTFQNTMYFV